MFLPWNAYGLHRFSIAPGRWALVANSLYKISITYYKMNIYTYDYSQIHPRHVAVESFQSLLRSTLTKNSGKLPWKIVVGSWRRTIWLVMSWCGESFEHWTLYIPHILSLKGESNRFLFFKTASEAHVLQSAATDRGSPAGRRKHARKRAIHLTENVRIPHWRLPSGRSWQCNDFTLLSGTMKPATERSRMICRGAHARHLRRWRWPLRCKILG